MVSSNGKSVDCNSDEPFFVTATSVPSPIVLNNVYGGWDSTILITFVSDVLPVPFAAFTPSLWVTEEISAAAFVMLRTNSFLDFAPLVSVSST